MDKHLVKEASSFVCIIIIDDSKDDAYIFKAFLKKIARSADITWFKNEQKFLDHLEKNKLHEKSSLKHTLLFLGVSDGSKDLTTVIYKIKQDPRIAQIPLIVICSSLDEKNRLLNRVQGIKDYLVRPKSYLEIENLISYLETKWFKLPA